MKFLGGVVLAISKLKVIWKAWDVRSFIVASFLFQIFLILISPLRKRKSSWFVSIPIWIAYLLADWVAAQAVGLISRATHVSSSAEADLFGLWAQFLLLHLGGPDTITAMALQDNELWIRTALHLGTQAYSTLGILVRSVRQSTIWIATVLMFLAGVVKYLERVTSLHHGRLLDIHDNPYKEYMTKLSKEDGGDEEEQKQKPLSNAAMVRDSYLLFQAYKCLYSDIQLKPDVQRAARKYFLKRTPEEAYKIVQMQLNFTYDAMYTKMSVMHKKSWRILRHGVLSLQVTSFVIWCLWDKQHFRGYDVCVTYALLIGGIVVDIVGFVRIKLSDWNVALHKKEFTTCDLVKCNASRTCRDMWSRLQNAHLSRDRWSMSIGLYDPTLDEDSVTKRPSNFDWLHKLLFHGNTHVGKDVRFDHEISNKWRFIFDMLTKPNKQQSYELPSSGVTLNMDELLNRGLPIPILDYNLVFDFWYYEYFNRRTEEELPTVFNHISKYLMYLISFQPNMMYAAAGKGTVISWQKDAVAYLESLEEEYEKREVEDERTDEKTFSLLSSEPNRGVDRIKDAGYKMMEVMIYVMEGRKVEVLEKVWGELLCYAAITCKPQIHAEKLKEGGEFLTFVWLLMVHLGIEPKTRTT